MWLEPAGYMALDGGDAGIQVVELVAAITSLLSNVCPAFIIIRAPPLLWQ